MMSSVCVVTLCCVYLVDIPVIPDLEDTQDDDMTQQVALAPK